MASAKFSSMRAYAEAKDFTLPRRSPSDGPVAVCATPGPQRPAIKPPSTITSGTNAAERIFLGVLESVTTRQALGSHYHNTAGGRRMLSRGPEYRSQNTGDRRQPCHRRRRIEQPVTKRTGVAGGPRLRPQFWRRLRILRIHDLTGSHRPEAGIAD